MALGYLGEAFDEAAVAKRINPVRVEYRLLVSGRLLRGNVLTKAYRSGSVGESRVS